MTPPVTPGEAWRRMSEALDNNAKGHLSAGDVCAVGFDLQHQLDAAASDDDGAEEQAPQQPNGTVARAQQYFDSAKDQLDQVDRVPDLRTKTTFIGRAVDDICDGLTHLTSAVASEADCAGWQEARR